MNARIPLIALALAAAHAAPALAESGDAMGLGVGAMALLTQEHVPAGASVTYDRGTFHVDGILGVDTRGATALLASGRFYYAIHRKAAADLSLGGGVGVETVEPEDDLAERATTFHIEAGAKIRAFIAPNVALSANVGAGALFGDRDGVVLTGQFIGTFGITYFLD